MRPVISVNDDQCKDHNDLNVVRQEEKNYLTLMQDCTHCPFH